MGSNYWGGYITSIPPVLSPLIVTSPQECVHSDSRSIRGDNAGLLADGMGTECEHDRYADPSRGVWQTWPLQVPRVLAFR